MICGDHVCINKAEAEQYFEENLTIEVKIVDEKIKKNIDLVELNLNENLDGKKKIYVSPKKRAHKKLKTLTEDEIINIKKNIKDKQKSKKIAKKVNPRLEISNDTIKNKSTINKEKKKIKEETIIQNKVNKKKEEVVDVCTILEKCSIDEISKYLLDRGKRKNFPNITIR